MLTIETCILSHTVPPLLNHFSCAQLDIFFFLLPSEKLLIYSSVSVFSSMSSINNVAPLNATIFQMSVQKVTISGLTVRCVLSTKDTDI